MPSSTPAGIFTDSVRWVSARPFAVAVRARVGDHLAAATTVRATALDDEKALLRADFAHPSASRAGTRTIVGLGAAAACALLAARERFDGDALFRTGECLFQRQLEIVAQIGAAGGVLARAARVHEFAENGRENVGETGEAGLAERIAVAAILERGFAEAVVRGPLLRVLETS